MKLEDKEALAGTVIAIGLVIAWGLMVWKLLTTGG